jgi:hypothetical protein
MPGSVEVVILVMLFHSVFMIWALVDLLGRSAADWDRVGLNRLVWAIAMIVVGVVGPITYLTFGRWKLNAHADSADADHAAFV